MPDSFRSGGPGHLPATLFSGALHFQLTSGIPCSPAIHSSSALNLIHSSPPSPPTPPLFISVLWLPGIAPPAPAPLLRQTSEDAQQ